MNRLRLLPIFITLLSTGIVYGYQAQEPTILIFVRHAEKADDGTKNPVLTEDGGARAANLYQVLSNDFDVSAVYSTPYNRTQLTARPTADSLGLQIINYGFDDIDSFLNNLITEYAGKAVLIVGHSNTTPLLVNRVLGEEKYAQLDESAYGDIFIVKTTKLGEGETSHAVF